MRTFLAHARPSSALVAFLVIACTGGDSRLVDPRPETSSPQYVVQLTTELDTLPFGESRLYSARVIDATGAVQSVAVVWTSTNPQVLTVGAGTATAIGFGSAGLVARFGNSADTATIVVSAAGFSLQVSPSAVAATLGDTLDFQARLVAPNGSTAAVQNVQWSLTDSSAAALVGDARVATLKEGDLDVIAAVAGETATASVKIARASVGSVTIDPPVASINVGESVDLNAIVRDRRGHVIPGAPVSWTVSDGSVATIDALGGVRGMSRGGVVVTATSGSKNATSTLTVAPRPAASVTLTIDPATIVVGSSLQITGIPRDAQGQPVDGRPIAYQSGNPAIATITNTGLITAVAAGVATISAICDGQVATRTLTVQIQRVASVAVVPSAPVIMQGMTATLAANVLDQAGQPVPNAAITWVSQSPSIAAVSSAGLLTGVALGSSQITATAGGVTGTAIATVNTQAIASVTVAPSSLSLQVGQSGLLSATAFTGPSAPLSGASFSWISSNSAVATVSALGVVSARAAGAATITATSGGKSSSASVSVSAPAAAPVASIGVVTAAGSLTVGQSTQATATVYDAQGNVLNGRVVTWSSTDTSVAKVSSNGLITALAAGSVAIGAASEGRTAFASIVIAAPPAAAVASLSVSAPNSSLQAGKTSQLSVTLRDAAGNVLTDRTILYSTSNASIATVSASGLVTAKAPGAATIAASSESVSRSIAFTVTSAASTPLLTKVSLSPEVVTVNAGATTQFTVSGTWSDGSSTIPSVTYSATGGTVSVTGVFTAGLVPGNYIVVARAVNGLSATANVVIESVQPVVQNRQWVIRDDGRFIDADGPVLRLKFAYNATPGVDGWFKGGGGRDGGIVELYDKETSATRNLVFRNGTWGGGMDNLDYFQAETAAVDIADHATPDFLSGTDAVVTAHRVWEDAGRLFAEFDFQFEAWRIVRTYIVQPLGDITVHARITLIKPGRWNYLGHSFKIAAARQSIPNGQTFDWGGNYEADGEIFHAWSDGQPLSGASTSTYYRYDEPLRRGIDRNTAIFDVNRTDNYSGFMLDDRNGNDPDVMVMNGDASTLASPFGRIAQLVGGTPYAETGIFSPDWARYATYAGINWFYATIPCCPPQYSNPRYWPASLGTWEENLHVLIRRSVERDDYVPIWQARARDVAQQTPTQVSGATVRFDGVDRLHHLSAAPGVSQVQFTWKRATAAPRAIDYRTAFVVENFPGAAWVKISGTGAPAIKAFRDPQTGNSYIVLVGPQSAEPQSYRITVGR